MVDSVNVRLYTLNSQSLAVSSHNFAFILLTAIRICSLKTPKTD